MNNNHCIHHSQYQSVSSTHLNTHLCLAIFSSQQLHSWLSQPASQPLSQWVEMSPVLNYPELVSEGGRWKEMADIVSRSGWMR